MRIRTGVQTCALPTYPLAEPDRDPGARHSVDLLRRLLADRAQHQVLGGVLDDAGRLALSVSLDHPAGHTGRVAVDPREPHRPRVEHQHVRTVATLRARRVGGDPVAPRTARPPSHPAVMCSTSPRTPRPLR